LSTRQWRDKTATKMAEDHDGESGFVGLYLEEMTWPGVSDEEMDALRAAWRVGLTIPKTPEWLLAYRLAARLQQSSTRTGASAVEPAEQDGWQVRRIKQVLPVACPNGAHEKMSIVAVRKVCAPEFEKRGWPLPGPDSFSRALDRRA
jgi:hypothetical protein